MSEKSDKSEMSDDLRKSNKSEMSDRVKPSDAVHKKSERFTKPRTSTSDPSEVCEGQAIRRLNIDKVKRLAKQYNISGVSRYPASRKEEIVENILKKRRSTDIQPQEDAVEESESDVGWLVLGLLAVGSLGVFLSSRKLLNRINGNER